MDVVRALLARLSWRVALYLAVLFGGLFAFVVLVNEFYEDGGFFFDEPVLRAFYGLFDPILTRVAVALSVLGSVEVMAVLAAVVVVALWRVVRHEAVFFLLAMGGSSLMMLLSKLLIARQRPALFPDVNVWSTASPSFPSGHATGSFAFFLALYLVTARHWRRRRWIVAAAGALLVLGISLSRLYLQVHYPSDILAGWSLAAAWVLGVNAFYLSERRVSDGRFVLLKLPRELIAAYRREAEVHGLDFDEAAARLLRRGLEAGGPVEPEGRPGSSAEPFRG